MYKVYNGGIRLGLIERKPMLGDVLDIEGSKYKVTQVPEGRKRIIKVMAWSEVLGTTKSNGFPRETLLKIKFKAYDNESKRYLDSEELIFQGGLWFENFKALERYQPLDVEGGKITIYQQDKFLRWNKVE